MGRHFVSSNRRFNMKSSIFFGVTMNAHGYPGLNKTKIKRSDIICYSISATKAAIVAKALELKRKGLAFLEEHFSDKRTVVFLF